MLELAKRSWEDVVLGGS